jgi:hypothetical protein
MKQLTYAAVLAVLTALALAGTASAATGSAAVLTTETGGDVETPTIHLVSEGGHVSFHNPEANIECTSTATFTPTSHGEGEPVSGPVSSFSFSGCTGGWQVTTNSAGSLSMDRLSGHNGSVTSDGATLTATLNLFFFHVTCRYKTENTPIGTITGGNPATLHIEASVPFHSGSGVCGEEPSTWTGNYTATGALFAEEIAIGASPLELAFKNAGEELKVSIKNKGTVPFKALTVGLKEKKEFELKGTCDKIKLAAGATCEETVKCKKAKETDELSVAGLNVAIVGVFVPLTC